MKSIILSVLPLAASAAVLQPRVPQGINPNSPFGPLAGLLKGLNSSQASATVAKALPKAPLFKVTNIKAELRPGAKRSIALFGPYVLAGREVSKYKFENHVLD
jgi:hypothetical protein